MSLSLSSPILKPNLFAEIIFQWQKEVLLLLLNLLAYDCTLAFKA